MDSFIKWFGGKSRSRDEIISIIPAHKTYIEPFAGASWILFDKPTSPIEVINDIDHELVNLYLVIQNNLDEFIEFLNEIPISEYIFKKYADQEGIPDVKSACRTYYIITNSFNANISHKPSFAVSKNRQSGFTRFHRIDWNAIKDRLKETMILCRDFPQIITEFDSLESFFYLDPPYTCATDSRRYYRYTFSGRDHENLAVYLADIEGKFILSYDDVPEIRERYSEFNIRKVSNGDLMIYNYEPADSPFYCRQGIPSGTMEGLQRRSAWYISNCPYCESREVQQLYIRKTLPNKSRTFKPNGYSCRSCGEVFK